MNKHKLPSQKPPRLDRVLKTFFPSLTHRHIEQALEAGLVCGKGGKHIRKGDRDVKECELDVTKLKKHLAEIELGNPDLQVPVVAETDDYWVVDKPAGVASHPVNLFDTRTLTHWAFSYCPEIRRKFTGIQPTLVPHRLDTSTSGLILVAKNLEAFLRLRQAFDRKLVHKKYWARAWGQPRQQKFEVNFSLAHSATDRSHMVVPAQGQPFIKPVFEAQSLVTILRSDKDLFLAEIECYTGATHQVRVHLAAMGYPILGDELYDSAYAQRPIKPPHHELRAVELSVLGKTYRVARPEAF